MHLFAGKTGKIENVSEENSNRNFRAGDLVSVHVTEGKRGLDS